MSTAQPSLSMGRKPLLFAVDASGRTAGVCVQQEEELLFEQILNEGLTHSETLLPLIDTAFCTLGMEPKDVDLYAVTGGPGSFTGLRIGMALVKGLALPGNVPMATVSTLLAAARGCPFEGRIVAALDARRGEVYWALFERGRGGKGFQRLLTDAAQPAAALAEKLDFSADRPLCFTGDGAAICLDLYGGMPGVEPQPAPCHIARGTALEALDLWQQGSVDAAEKARPAYLRLSQAERERIRREDSKPKH